MLITCSVYAYCSRKRLETQVHSRTFFILQKYAISYSFSDNFDIIYFPSTVKHVHSSSNIPHHTVNTQSVSSGTTLWYVTVHASFTYNGSTSSCTSADVTAESNSSAWKVTNKSSWKSGNTGYASATGSHILSNSEITSTTRTVSISCTKNGTLQ